MLDIWKVKRKEARIHLAVPVTIEGLDGSDQAFVEETTTENVSKNGACIVVSRILKLGSVITIMAFQGRFKCQGEIRAIWVDENDKKKKIGILFTEPTVNWVVS